MSAAYTTAHSNTGSLTHWVKLRIDLHPSWMLVKFVSTEPQQKLLFFIDFLFCPHQWHVEVPTVPTALAQVEPIPQQQPKQWW